MRVTRKNPRIGKHPDLFGGESGTHKDVDDMTDDELLALPRDAYTDDEFAELDEWIQEQIHERDPKSKKRIQRLVDLFVDRYKWATEPEYIERYEYESDFDWFFGQSSQDYIIDHLHDYDSSWAANLYAEAKALGYSEDQIEEALAGEDGVLRDSGNYDEEVNVYSQGLESFAINGSIYIERAEIEDALANMHPEEIELAVVEISDETNDVISLGSGDLPPPYEYTVDDIETGYYANLIPKENQIEQELLEALEGKEVPLPPVVTPPEERVLHRFDDGSYLVNLEAGELPDESAALGHCVGDASHGYIGAVLRGDTAIWSLRTAAGRPKLTIEVELDSQGEPLRIEQVKGKRNRLPGYPAGGGKFKPDEVKKLIEAFEALDVEFVNNSDMKKALAELFDTPGSPHYIGPGSGERDNPYEPVGFDVPWRPYDER